MTLPELAALLGLNLALLIGAMLGLWALSLRLQDVSFVDGVWPLGMLLLALVTFARTDGDVTRKGLLLWLCGVWAIRLGWHLLRRWREKGVDGRYAEIVETQEREHGWSFAKTALLFVFLPQAFLGWLTCLPVQLGQVEHGPMGWIGWIGAMVVVVGIGFESIGDAQLDALLPQGPEEQGQGAGHRPVALHPPPQLFRRRLCLVGAVADRGGNGLGRHRLYRGTCLPDVHPDAVVGHRHHRKGYRPDQAQVRRLHPANERLCADAAAQIETPAARATGVS